MKKLKFLFCLLPVVLAPRLMLADLVGPYTPDASTLFLLHFDEAAGGTVAANAGLKGGNFYSVDESSPSATPPTVTTMLGAAGYVNGATNFNNCMTNPTAGYLFGYDANNSGAYQGEGSAPCPDALAMTNLNIGNGGQTPFTIEALIQPTITSVNQEIVCTDSSAGSRGFQFRITGGTLQFQFIAGGQAVSGTIPTSGSDAFVAGTWYHVAMTYDGAKATLYWTKLDPANGAAHVLASANLTLGTTQGAVTGPLCIGNENRGTAGELFQGSIDEVRISSVARAANQMQFYSPLVTITQNPVSQNIDYNQPVNFSVGASSLTSLGYQWRFNSNAISGFTNSAFTITNVAASDAGYYDCVVTNMAGYAATSSPALLVVGAANFLANRYSFSTTSTDPNSGMTVTPDSVGGQWGTNFGTATVTGGKLVLDGSTDTFMQLPGGLFNATNATALTVEFWATYGSNPANVYTFAFGVTNYVLNYGIQGFNHAMYSSHAGVGQVASATPGDPIFAQTVTATGNLDGRSVHVAVVFDPPNKMLSIYTNGVLEAVNTNFTVNISSLNDQLSYVGKSLWASDPFLNASIDEIRIFKGALSPITIKQSQDQGPDTLLADGPAEFVLEPVDTRIPDGRTVTFSAAAVGYLPITYQWFKNGTLIPDATNASYSFTAALGDNNSTFQVNATNTIGVTTYVVSSSNATLNVFIPPNLVWVGNGSADWDYSTPNNWSNTVSSLFETFAQYDGAIFDDRGSFQPYVYLTQAVEPGQVTVNSSSDYTFISSGSLVGQGGLLKQGTGKLTLNVANTLAGPTVIQGGTLQVGNSDTVGSLGSGPVTNNGTLSFARSDSISVSNPIHGSGTLSLDYGTLVVQGSNDFSGGTLVNSGILNLQNSAGLGSASSGTTIANGAQIYLTANVDVAEPLTLSGPGDANGALRKGGGGYSAWTGPVIMTSDTTFGVDGGATLNLSNTVSGAAVLAAAGSSSGTLALSANNTYSGGTTLSGPIINLNANGALGTGPVTVNGAGRFVIGTGLNITNSFLAYAVNPGTATGFIMANDNTNGSVTTVSGPLELDAAAASGGHFIGPVSSGYLNVAGPVTMPGGTPMIVRDGRVRFSNAGSSFTEIQVRAGTTSIGENNGISTTAVMDLAGNGTAFFDLNGFNQTLAGLQNNVAPANAGLGFVTNSSATTATLTLDLMGGYFTSGSGLAGNLSLVLQSGTQVFTGTNHYTGNTTVNGGTLELATASLSSGSTVSVAGGAVLQLDFAGTNQVSALVLEGTNQAPGVYNNTTSPTYIYGSGSLLVSPGPSGPAHLTNSVSGSTLSLSWPAGQNWRLEMQTNSLSKGLGTNWVDVTPGTASSTNITINPAKPAVFYRLVYP